MRVFLTAVLLNLFATITLADTFMGRSLEITDGRSDRSRAAPLIIAMHGFLGTPHSMRRKTSFDALARAHGFVVVYPKGIGRRWNDGRRPGGRTDDVAYLSALITSLIAQGRVEADRVYAAGHSNGGGMAMRLACDRPDLVAGIAVGATNAPTNYTCRRGQPTPAIFFHGTVDPISPPQGRAKEDRLGGALSVEATLAVWSKRNGCKGQGKPQITDAKDDGTVARMISYTGCRAPLVHVSIDGHGHGWPGAGPRLRRLQGPATQEVDAAAQSWRFFSGL